MGLHKSIHALYSAGLAIRADLAAVELAELADLAELAELAVDQTHARNTDSARIRPFFRSLFGLSPMNVDMSVSLVMPETLT